MSEDEVRGARERVEALTIAISVRSLPQVMGSLLESNLTIPQLKVLTSIVVTDDATASSLAHAFEVSMPTMSKLIDRLAEQSLVERVADAGDHRIRRLRVTSRGRDVVGRIMVSRPELGIDVLSGLSLAELTALEIGMRAVDREIGRLRP